MMNVHLRIIHVIDDIVACFDTDVRAFDRIALVAALGEDLKGKWLIAQTSTDMVNEGFTDVREVLIRDLGNRADLGDTEYVRESRDQLVLVVVGKRFHKDASLLLLHAKTTVDTTGAVDDAVDESVFEFVAVFAFDADFGVFY